MATSEIPTEEQDRIVNHDGSVIVVANPGTGKTTTLALRVRRLLEQGTNPEDILCITFTRKARREMHEKIIELGAAKFAEQVERVNIQTFHGFAYNYMAEKGIITGKTTEDNALRFAVFESLTKNDALNYNKDYVIAEIVPKTATAIKYVKNFGIMPDHIDQRRTADILERVYDKFKKSGKSTKYTIEETKAFLQYFIEAYRAYEDAKTGSSDYTDILLQFRKNVSGPLYGHALIDEMQDMNQIQAGIAKNLADTTFLVGDPRQAIFGFQGGSTKYLESFKSECTTEELTKNMRSTDEILEYAKQYYLASTNPSEDTARNLQKLKSGRAGSKPVIISTEHPLSSMLDAIRKNQDQEIGILARTNAQVLEISGMLDENGIPHTSATAKATTETAKKHITDFLAGLLRGGKEAKIRASFTAFSPYSLKEAFEISEAYSDSRKDPEGQESLFGKLDEMCGDAMSLLGMNRLFEKTIFPICVAEGDEWFFTARAVKLEIDEYLSSDMPTAEGLFDYLAVCEEPGIEHREGVSKNDGTDAKGPSITLSTIHKAKGREFDMVIYWPKNVGKFDFMDIIKEAILESCDTDVGAELAEEQSRLHFVAMTRAKNNLIIIADGRIASGFEIGDAAEVIKDKTAEEEPFSSFAPIAMTGSGRLKEAYSLFVNKQTAESRRILESAEGDRWLADSISSYFEDLERLSYSAMCKEASEFLKRNIIEIPRPSSSSEFGSMLHDAMERVLKDGLENMDEAVRNYCSKHGARRRGGGGGGGDKKHAPISLEETMRNGCDAISEIKTKYTGVEVDAVEKKVEVPLSVMTDHGGTDGITFAGKIDVVLRHDSGYAIIDYKTDKEKGRLVDHNMQLAAYKRMLARSCDIPEESIDTYVVFVAIRGRVNTGRLDYEQVKSKKDVYGKFEKMLARVLDWKSDPQDFVRQVLEEGPAYNEDKLYESIRKELESEAALSAQ